MKAPVNKIISLSVVDGPGNRTVVFLQGCNISCAYCHNPETQRLCIGCGICATKCPVQALTLEDDKTVWARQKCVQCDACIQNCPHFSSPKVRDMEVEEVFTEIMKNVPFIRGITVSGGECTLYPEFLTELFCMVNKEGLSCFIDTNGCIELERYAELMRNCDKVMLDVKAWEPEVFRDLTGGENSPVKKNLIYLAEQQKLEEVRMVCMENVVDVETIIQGIAATIPGYLADFTLKLIAFRNFGVVGKFAETRSPSKEQMEQWKELSVQNGIMHTRIV